MKNRNKAKAELPEVLSGDLPLGKEVMSEEEAASLKKKNKKRKMLAAIAIVTAVGIVSGVVLYLDPFSKLEYEGSLGMYGSDKSYLGYAIDYDLEVDEVPEYQELDRNIYFLKNNEKYSLDDVADKTPDVEFWYTYFDLVIYGKYNEYNALFTDEYYNTDGNEPYVRFTQQMVYDITVEKLSETYSGGVTKYTYNVSYRIHRNNNTFRNDIGSDGMKTLFFELVYDGEEVKINRITYYV